ncbi:uncharacterized protein [Mytilus edulis]|uniref:uncharacterized protein n=1 Tax=Mytilus edulis TaxID=6550 RepID=UPI0039F044DE
MANKSRGQPQNKTPKLFPCATDHDFSTLTTKLKIKEDMLDKIDQKNKQLYLENERLKRKNEILERDKEAALSRLSKIAGEKLAKGNPSITDLGDPNRPTKLGERWSSLYTDEWTDAFEEISTKCKTNKTAVPEKILLKIVDWCYTTCSKLSQNQAKVIEKLLRDVALQLNLQDESKNDINKNIHGKCNITVSEEDDSIKPFIETFRSQRQNNERLMETAVKRCVDDYLKSNKEATENEIIFVKKCSELCWCICIADPPMVIEYKNCERKLIDSTKFNKYNRSGTTVEFVVWPTLLLYKDGPVLAKGTVQTNG